ncbi:Iron-regulated ABC transporter permease protein SufD [Tistlia consotensis]|uniref:Iron-regulated ABC transporter permease protein SufD n=1 Tax=Tistlia consotensis USBA 355 TaxID=560819 RepID=A0A1Y6CQW5_9PROT|nr:Fe-S cluster assembly protein SufD [Tistlia consotensis]SMF82608.1 Iron-regulated ABC transporter permease protein SufD [Tistlia consotensis USBA 355]SNS29652.1 Iron-regulated ABC transporter permease protein SufD [Tistlia consotensis]
MGDAPPLARLLDARLVEEGAAALPGAGLPWLAERRKAAAERFRALGLPHRRLEAWKYTDLPRALKDRDYLPAQRQAPASLDAVPALTGDEPLARLVFVDGLYRAELSRAATGSGSLPDGVRLLPLAQALEREPGLLEGRLDALTGDADGADPQLALLALNAALLDDGLVLLVEPGVAVPGRIELVQLGGLGERPVFHAPRHLVVLGEGASATLVERILGVGPTGGLANAVTELRLGKGAALTHLRLQEANEAAIELATTFGALEAGARYEAFALTLGAALSRHEIDLTLDGEDAEVALNGAYLLRGRQHGDTTTRIVHRVPDTRASETYKGALDDEARAVFQGLILVERGAQKTDGRMLNKTLLLSDKAEVDSKPELEIYADDVQCAHGATAGEIDADALFYLRSRGLDQRRARALLIEAFLAEAIESLSDEGLREPLLARVRAWLQKAGEQDRNETEGGR